MKNSKHITATWLLGVFLHPLIYIIYFSIPSDHMLSVIASAFIIGVFFSLPAFLLSRQLFFILKLKPWSLFTKYLLLISGAASSVFNVVIVFAFLMQGRFYLQIILEMSIPGIIAASLAPVIMYRKLSEQLHSPYKKEGVYDV